MSATFKSAGRWLVAALACCALAVAGHINSVRAAQLQNTPPGQFGQPGPPGQPGQPALPGQPGQPRSLGDDPSAPAVPPAMAAAAERARNNERQKRLVADSDRLLALATQLHADVARTDKNILSVDVIHRADEIEKLAHSVKERMKGQ